MYPAVNETDFDMGTGSQSLFHSGITWESFFKNTDVWVPHPKDYNLIHLRYNLVSEFLMFNLG